MPISEMAPASLQSHQDASKVINFTMCQKPRLQFKINTDSVNMCQSYCFSLPPKDSNIFTLGRLVVAHAFNPST